MPSGWRPLWCIVRNNPTIRKITTKFQTFWWLLHCGYSLSHLRLNKREQGFPEVVPAILNRQTRGEGCSITRHMVKEEVEVWQAIVVVHGSQRFCTLTFLIWAGTELTDFSTLITLVVTLILGSLWSSGESAASPSCPLILCKPRDLTFQSTNIPSCHSPPSCFLWKWNPDFWVQPVDMAYPGPLPFWRDCLPLATPSSNAVAEFLNMFSHTLPPRTSDIYTPLCLKWLLTGKDTTYALRYSGKAFS